MRQVNRCGLSILVAILCQFCSTIALTSCHSGERSSEERGPAHQRSEVIANANRSDGRPAKSASQTASPAPHDAAGEERTDQGAGTDGSPSSPTKGGPTSLAWGRLIAELPTVLELHQPDLGPPGEPGQNAFADCHYRALGDPQTLGVCTAPSHVESAELERYSRWHLEKQGIISSGTVDIENVKAADTSLKVIRAVPEKAFLGISSRGAYQSAAMLYVGHPDGTVISLEFTFATSRDEAVALADQVAKTLRPGPVKLNATAGTRKLYLFHENSHVDLPLPERFTVVLHEGLDSWDYVVSRPHRVEVKAPLLAFGLHNSPSPMPLAEEFPDHTGRREVKLFGRTVQFVTKMEKGHQELVYREMMAEFDMYLSIHAPPGRELDQLVKAFEAATLNLGVNPILEAEMGGERGEKCGFFIVDRRPPLNVRTTPSAKAAVVGTLDDGAVVEIAEQRGSWVKLKSPTSGWVFNNNVRRQCVRE